MHRLESREKIDEFYRGLGKGIEAESQAVLVLKAKDAARRGILRPDPEIQVVGLRRYYSVLFLYGSEVGWRRRRSEDPVGAGTRATLLRFPRVV